MSKQQTFNVPTLKKRFTFNEPHRAMYKYHPKTSLCLDVEQKELRQTNSTLSQTPKSGKNLKPSDFKIIKHLGNGKFGAVYLVKHCESGFIMAMKVISKAKLQGDSEEDTKKMMAQLIQEIKTQIFFNHPNLVKLYSFFSDFYKVYLLMELGCDGQLYELVKEGKSFSEETTSYIVRQTLLGVNEMHKNFVIHRDIKPENIVLVHGVPKICDFGWSVYCPKEVRSTLCGTPLYLSPEILKGNTYNEKIDTWAIGTLTHELLTGKNPFEIKKKSDLARIITDSVKMDNKSKQAIDFITTTLEKDPELRPKSDILLTHLFLRKYEELETCEQLCQLLSKKKKPLQ